MCIFEWKLTFLFGLFRDGEVFYVPKLLPKAPACSKFVLRLKLC